MCRWWSAASSRPRTRRCSSAPAWRASKRPRITTSPPSSATSSSWSRASRVSPPDRRAWDGHSRETAMDKIKPLFTATATATGGRNGHTEASDGTVKADLSVPKAMGGPGKPGTATPEHLFAAGYAACFGGSLDFVAKQKKKDASRAEVTCGVMIGARAGGGFGLAVKVRVEDKSIAQAELATFVREAHEKVCPYSHATRGNVEVALDV